MVNRLFTKEQEDFIKKNVGGVSNKTLTELINKEFCLSITVQQVKTWKHNHKLSSGLTGRFEKGHEPINKGTKGLFNVGGNETSFKKGHKPNNFKSIGTSRIDRDGYKLVKVCDDGPWHKRWRPQHKILWEKLNGKIPVGHKLIFLNQNKQDIRIENLALVTDGELLRMNRMNLVYDNPELTKSGILIAKVYNAVAFKKKHRVKKEPVSSGNDTSHYKLFLMEL